MFASDDLQMQTAELEAFDGPPMTGVVRWFNAEKGYGFIAPEDGSPDVFVRFSAIEADGFRTLAPDQRVSFLRSTDARGPRAVDVRAIDAHGQGPR